MADNPNSVGDIVVTITGDAAPLQDFLNLAENLADDYGPKIADGIGKGAAGADKTAVALQALKDTFSDLGPAVDALNDKSEAAAAAMLKVGSAAQDVLIKQQSLETNVRTAQTAYEELRVGFDNGTVSAATLARAQDQLADAITKANPQLTGLTPGIQAAGAAAGGAIPPFQDLVVAALGFAGIELSAKALLDFAVNALETYANIQKATIAIDALTGSAGKSYGIVNELKDLALQDALSFPTLLTAEQRMLAFGISSGQIPGVLRALADSAAATNKDIGTVSNAFDRIIESGNLSGRTLVQLGISMKDVAGAMGVTESSARAAFQALDQSERVNVLETALQKFAGTAQQVAESLSGQWQNLLTQGQLTFAGIGELLAPAASAILQYANVTVQSVGGLVSGFVSLKDSTGGLVSTVGQVGQSMAQAGSDAFQMGENVIKVAASILGFSSPVADATEKTKEWNGEFGTLEKSSDEFTQTLVGLINPINDLKFGIDYARASIELASGEVPQLGKTFEQLVDSIAKASTKTDEFQSAMSRLTGTIIPHTAGMDVVIKQQQTAEQNYTTAKTALDNLTASYQNQTADLKGHIATQDEVSRAYKNEETALKALDLSASGHIQTADQLEHKESDLQDAVDKARQSVSDASRDMANGTGSAGALKAAHEQLTAAVKAAHQEIAGHVLSLGDLLSKNAELNAALTVAEGVYDAVSARVRAGSGEYNAQSEALKQLISVHKQLGDAETNVKIIVETFKEKNADLTDKLTAQWQSLVKLEDEYGKDNLIVTQAEHAFDSLAKQVGLTRIQFEDLINESNATGESIIELVNKAGAVASAFKEMGVTSSAQFEQLAQNAHDSFDMIAADSKSMAGDVFASGSKMIEADNKYRDSLSASAAAAKDMGIQTVQMLQDLVDRYSRDAANIGNSLSDMAAAHKKVQGALDELRLATDPVAQAMQRMGIQSVEALTKVRDQAQADLDLMIASGKEYGVVEAATKKLQQAQENLDKALYGVGVTGVDTGGKLKQSFDKATASSADYIESISKVGPIIDKLGVIHGSLEAIGVKAWHDITSSAQGYMQVLLSIEQTTIAATGTMEDDFTRLTMTVEGLKQSMITAAAASDSFWKSQGGPGANSFMPGPSEFGGSGSSGMGSFQLGTQPGQYTIHPSSTGGFDLNQNFAFSGGGGSAQQAVDYYMAKGYSFADAKAKAKFDGWDVSGVKDSSAKGSSGGSSSTSSTPSTAGIETAAAAVTKAYESGDTAALQAAQDAYAKALAAYDKKVTVSAPTAPTNPLGLSPEDIAAFAAMGINIPTGTSSSGTKSSAPSTSVSAPSLMSMTEPTGSAIPSTSTAAAGATLKGMVDTSVQSAINYAAQLGSAQLVGMSSTPAPSTAPTSNYTGPGMTAAQVLAAQTTAAGQNYWAGINAAAAAGFTKPPAPAPVQQIPDTSTLQFQGGLSPTSTFSGTAASSGTGVMTLAEIQAALGTTPSAAVQPPAPSATDMAISTPAATVPTPPPSPAVTAPVAPAASTSAAGAAAGMSITTPICNLTVTGSLNGSGGTVVNVYATVSTQAMSDSLVQQIQSLGAVTGKL